MYKYMVPEDQGAKLALFRLEGGGGGRLELPC